MSFRCTSFFAFGSLLAALLTLTACGTEVYPYLTVLEATPLVSNPLTGNIAPVHDPSVIRQNGTYYVFSSDPDDPKPDEYLPIRCSTDTIRWKACGKVFASIPGWVSSDVPGISTL